MSEKKILNNSARALNLKIDNKQIGRANIQLVPGYNIVSAKVWRALRALAYCKSLVEDEVLDFSPKANNKKKPKPETVSDPRLIADPRKPLGAKEEPEEEEEELED